MQGIRNNRVSRSGGREIGGSILSACKKGEDEWMDGCLHFTKMMELMKMLTQYSERPTVSVQKQYVHSETELRRSISVIHFITFIALSNHLIWVPLQREVQDSINIVSDRQFAFPLSAPTSPNPGHHCQSGATIILQPCRNFYDANCET